MTSGDVTSSRIRPTLLLCVGRLLSEPLSIWHGQQLDGVIGYSKHITIAMQILSDIMFRNRVFSLRCGHPTLITPTGHMFSIALR
jgi:hypothetical protein